MYKILLLAQKPIGEQCFTYLMNNTSDLLSLAACVTNHHCDNWWGTNTIYNTCVERNIPVLTNETKNTPEILKYIKQYQINLIISVQHAWVLPPEILAAVNNQAFNLHLAKLPQYKGYNTYNHALLNGELDYSVTLHWMTEQVDQGDIAFERNFPISDKDTAKSLSEKSAHHGLELFKQLIASLNDNQPTPRHAMVGTECFYSRNSLNIARRINDPSDINEIDTKSRAMYFPPYEPAYIIHNDKKIYILPEDIYPVGNK